MAKQAKSGDPRLAAQLDELRSLLAWVDGDRPLSTYAKPLPAGSSR